MGNMQTAVYDSTGNNPNFPDQNKLPVVSMVDSSGKFIGVSGPKLNFQFVFSRIREAIEAAQRANPYLQAPLAPAPTWAVGTVYYGGQIVRGTAGASATGNLYLCCGNTTNSGYPNFGTSAGAGNGPSGTGSALITDNTCMWQYIGPALSAGTYPTYSSVTPTTSSDVMNGYLAFSDPNNLTAMGLTNQYSLSASACPVTFANGVLTDAVTYQPKNSGTVGTPNRLSNTVMGVMRFLTNSKKWVAIGGAIQGGAYPVNLKAIKVNGQWLSETNIGNNTLKNKGTYVLDLTKFGVGSKLVEVYFYDIPSNWTSATPLVSVGADEYVIPYKPSNSYKIAIEGNSITDMTYLSSFHHHWRLDVALGELLGCKNVYNNSIGGTGLIVNNSNTATRMIDRLGDIVTFAPDLLLVEIPTNDNLQSSADRQAAMLTYLKQVRALLPNVTVGLIGTFALQGADISTAASTSLLTVEQDGIAAWTAWNDSNSFVIPILTANPKLQTSTANGYFYSAGGSNDYSNSHPTSWYYYHMISAIVEGIKSFYGVN